ncbi:MAG: hypothetical protein ACYCSB_01340 [bacterium]|jgi:hypothetical protein
MNINKKEEFIDFLNNHIRIRFPQNYREFTIIPPQEGDKRFQIWLRNRGTTFSYNKQQAIKRIKNLAIIVSYADETKSDEKNY